MKSPFVRFASAGACLFASLPLFAQTTSTHKSGTSAHRTSSAATAHRTTSGCATVPTLSPKIPALPVGVGCAKVLYSITSSASQLSPMLSPALRDSLEKLDQSFELAYVDTKVGTGALAAPRMWYTVNYTGYLTDGTKFDSSEGKDPISFPYGGRHVIQGWDTGFEGMHVGGKRRLFIPYQLAYGENGRPPVIPPHSELVFDIELVSQSEQQPAPKTPPAPPAGGMTGSAPGAGHPVPNAAPKAPGTTSPAVTPSTPGGNKPPASPTVPPVTSTTPASPAQPTGASSTPRQ